jgi:alkylated DNA repair dioxygenase AlkB
MASIFVAPLFKINGFTPLDPAQFFLKEERGKVSRFELTRSENAVILFFQDTSDAELAAAIISRDFPDISVRLKKLPTAPKNSPELPVLPDDPSVPGGLEIVSDWLTFQQEAALVDEIDSLPWDTTIRRRVQHYGYQFKYSQLNVDSDTPVREFPPCVTSLIVERPEIAKHAFDQLTINEYVAGVGIASHCDTHSAFSDTIAVVSLLNSITMDFIRYDNSGKVSVVIPPRSLMLMSGESRLGWRHSIASRKSDINPDGVSSCRGRRVSLTFRRIVPHQCSCPFSSLCDSQGADASRPRRMKSG